MVFLTSHPHFSLRVRVPISREFGSMEIEFWVLHMRSQERLRAAVFREDGVVRYRPGFRPFFLKKWSPPWAIQGSALQASTIILECSDFWGLKA